MTNKPYSVIVAIRMPSKIIELEIPFMTEAGCIQWIEQAPEHENLEYTWGLRHD